jgi:hypothetical protein
MAVKGDRARLYDVAMRMYTDGASLTDIEATLGVSRQTLSAWKADTRRPGDDQDLWDKGRAQKIDGVQRILNLYYRELGALEEQPAGSLSSTQVDAISKLGALVMKWEQREEKIRKQTLESAADVVEKTAKKQGASAVTIDALRAAIMTELSS